MGITRIQPIKCALWTAAAMVPLAVPAAANADHDRFAYRGHCYGFAGEQHMIAALNSLDQVYARPHGGGWALARAEHHLRLALVEVCQPQSRFFLHGALDHVRRFRHFRNLCDLEDAVRLVTRALYAEQAGFLALRRTHVLHRHHHVLPPTVIVPAPTVAPGISLGTRWGRIDFNF